jgi:hypothetical protein
MVRMVGGTHFLVFRGGIAEPDGSHVHSYNRFDEALAKWDAHSRISPIFALEGAGPPKLSSREPCWLFFLGPVFPGVLAELDFSGAYLTLGILNVVLFCTTPKQRDAARALAKSLDATWEEWPITEHVVGHVAARPSTEPRTIPREILGPIRTSTLPFLPTIREAQTLLATTYARALVHNHPVDTILFRFSMVFRQLLDRPELMPVEKLAYLVTTNVALSRHLWQTYSGSASIAAHPCNLSTNSLLAIGTASLALENLARFLEKIYETARLPERLAHLKNVPPYPAAHPIPLANLPSTDPFWTYTPLFKSEPSYAPPDPEEAAQHPHLPQLTYFSSRDGFRSTDISLSAPLEVITGCNTPFWTLHTLTHEVTHTLIHSIMGQLLPDLTDEISIQQTLDLLRPDTRPASLHDQFRAFLTYAIWRINSSMEELITARELGSRIRRDARDADEILTHVFDYLYHYHSDSGKYIKAVWVSWATIPNIGDRVSQYVVRCLCAIHSNNLRRENGVSITIDTMFEILTRVREDFPEAQYLRQAIDELTTRREHYIRKLNDRGLLVKFVRYVLFSEDLEREMARGRETVESLKAQYFGDERIANPLAFVEQWSQDNELNPIRSIWMLQYLAHGLSQ